MKIIYIYDSIARIGGVERVLVDKMNYLADNLGYEVYLLTSCQGNHPLSFPLSNKVIHRDIDARFHLQYKYKFIRRQIVAYRIRRKFMRECQSIIDEIKPDVVIGTNYYEPAVICSLRTKAKIVIESHIAKSHSGDADGFRRSFLKKLYDSCMFHRRIRAIEKHCDYLVTLTNADRKEWNIEDARITVIPNPITKCSDKTSDCSAFRVMCAGRLNEQKGFDMMIDAWNIVNKNHPNWHLYIYGEGEEENKLHAQIMKLGLENTINIMPFSHNIYEEYLKSSIFVLPSRYEGFGLVLIEAMSCGLPCVAFDCPHGPSDIIRDKEDGLIVENGNVEALANAICWMIEHNDERKTMGRKAKENVKRYSLDVIMSQWDEFLQKTVRL